MQSATVGIAGDKPPGAFSRGVPTSPNSSALGEFLHKELGYGLEKLTNSETSLYTLKGYTADSIRDRILAIGKSVGLQAVGRDNPALQGPALKPPIVFTAALLRSAEVFTV